MISIVAVAGGLMLSGTSASAKETVIPVEVDPGIVICGQFMGFGAEWDSAGYLASGVTDEDFATIRKRVEWMRLPMVRIMMQSKWCYKGNGRYDWDDVQMKTLYRQLDVCQQLGIKVILTEWGVEPNWLKTPDVAKVEDPQYAGIISSYMEHLLNTKGYSCIKYFILVNEPNHEIKDWPRWKAGVLNVSGEFQKKGLAGKVAFMGSDHSGGDLWHSNAVDQLQTTLGAYDIHRYAPEDEVRKGALLDYYKASWGYALARDPKAGDKPLIVTEAGMDSLGFSALNNPLHLDPRYGILMGDYAVQAANAGSWAVLAWMLDDNSHKGFNWGMCKSKKEGLATKPWFYTWALLSRTFRPGSHIVQARLTSSDVRVLAAYEDDKKMPGGRSWSFCLVNRADKPLTLRLSMAGGTRLSFNRYVYSTTSARTDKDGFPVAVGQESCDFGAGADFVCEANSVTILSSLNPGVLPDGGQMIPDLPWEKRSDWIDVKTDVTPAAKGDGIADDTEAIQAAFKKVDWNSKLKAIYLPAGTYRITKTLTLGGEQFKGGIVGGMIIGHGRSTRIVWDGAPGGVMIKDLGFMMSSHVGYVLDGRGKAATGVLHAGQIFETSMLYRHMAFLNLTGEGISIGKPHEGNLESAELLYDNCLFERCGTGVSIQQFNDYDNTFAGCEFRQCGIGIANKFGNFYVRDSHFEGSTTCDIVTRGEHGSSIRRCSSYGSALFLDFMDPVAGFTIQDCRVDAWTNPGEAIRLSGAPVLMMDCVFGSSSKAVAGKAVPPVKLGNWSQRLIQSHNQVAGEGPLCDQSLFDNSRKNKEPGVGAVYDIPAGTRGGVMRSAQQSFLQSQVTVPGKVFDAKRDFGAKGDGVQDDTEAIQKAVAAARAHGKESVAYLPIGQYRITRTLELGGAHWRFGGCGPYSQVVWGGADGGTMVHIADPDHLTVENLDIGASPNTRNSEDIVQTSSGTNVTSICYDRLTVYGPAYDPKSPRNYLQRGLRLEGLKKNDTVLIKYILGNLHCVDSAEASILCNVSFNTGHIVVEGKGTARGGFLGVMNKLGVCENPTLTVKDNHSIVISDLYIESVVSCFRLEGNGVDLPGRITIQGAKICNQGDEYEKTPQIIMDNYRGELTVGPDQFYLGGGGPKVSGKGDQPLSLLFLGNYLYNCSPQITVGPKTTVLWIGNAGTKMDDTPLAAAIPQIVRSLDDLRRLGELDVKLNHPGPE